MSATRNVASGFRILTTSLTEAKNVPLMVESVRHYIPTPFRLSKPAARRENALPNPHFPKGNVRFAASYLNKARKSAK
jgi:hypothetical protein